MAIIKCKMCGGDLVLIEGQSVAECDSCGRLQTVPAADNEKKLSLFSRANRLRTDCDFDKAAGVYETIIGEFPEETEAYWGLVLCKYGIEYVDDPATGKKVPTCHRTLPKSIMEDPDYQETLRTADVVAAKIYQEEAAQIDHIQQRILSIVSQESPYDVFICYKETDDDTLLRTEDSADAQDLFTELTKDGYRVFFARNTLKSVAAGSEYEPYIYAALSSAKVMLAIGSREEYFNAVWVKNEWVRFLDMMKTQPGKVLIPCYKNMDPYDMPRAFRNLQALNMSDLTFYSTLKGNLERAIPKKKVSQTVVQERVVVGGSGNNKIASLLDRGNMALEDGDWAKADSFFEDVLNNDSKNAQAYLGKTLAQEKCRTIDAFARKRKEISQNVRGQMLSLEPNSAHVDAMVQKYSLPGYVDGNEIRKLYDFDLSYHSDVAERKQQYRNEENYWMSHKQLSRAEKFAVGAVAENLANEKKVLFAALANRVDKAEAAEAAAKKEVQTQYEAHLHQADAQAEALYNDGLNRREQYYENLLQTAKTSADVAELKETAKKFDRMDDFRDSRNLAEHCRKRAAEEQAKIDAEAEHQRILKGKQEKARKAKNKRIAVLTTAIVSVVIAVVLVVTLWVIPNGKYNEAISLAASGEYESAMHILDEIVTFKDSEEKYKGAFIALKAGYREQAEKYLEDGDLINASIFYAKAGESAYADQIFNIHTRFAVDEYIIAGIMKDGTLKYQSDYDNDHNKEDALEHLNGVVSLVAHTTEGINGLDAAGKLQVHDINLMNRIEIRDSMRINTYSGIKQIVHGINNEYYVVMLMNDGRVVCAAEDNVQIFPDVKNWKNIREIRDYHDYILGIDADGKVHIAFAKGEEKEYSFDVSNWPAVKNVFVLSRDRIVGLTTDNRFVTTSKDAKTAVDFLASLTGVVDLQYFSDSEVLSYESNGYQYAKSVIAVLMEDGRVKLFDYDGNPVEFAAIDAWREVVNLQTGLNGQMIGITHNGTIECYGDAVAAYADWTDIVAVQSYNSYYPFSVGVKMDGTVLTTSDGTYSISEEVTGANGNTSYVDRERTGGTYCDVSSWDLW